MRRCCRCGVRRAGKTYPIPEKESAFLNSTSDWRMCQQCFDEQQIRAAWPEEDARHLQTDLSGPLLDKMLAFQKYKMDNPWQYQTDTAGPAETRPKMSLVWREAQMRWVLRRRHRFYQPTELEGRKPVYSVDDSVIRHGHLLPEDDNSCEFMGLCVINPE